MADYQGPQKPGYGFTPTGGSAPLVQGPLRPGETRTTSGFVYKGSADGGGSSSSASSSSSSTSADPFTGATDTFKNPTKNIVKTTSAKPSPPPNSISVYKELDVRNSPENEWMKSPSPYVKSGTITSSQSPFYTYGEQQKSIELTNMAKVEGIKAGYVQGLNEFSMGLQSDINAGKIEYSAAQDIFATRTSEATVQLNTELAGTKLLPEVVNPNIGIKEIGGSLIESLPPIAFGKAIKENQMAPIIINDAASVNLQNIGNYNTATGSEYNKYAITGLVNTIIPAAIELRSIEKGIISAQLEGLSNKPWQFSELRIGAEEGTSILTATRTDRGLTQNLKLFGKVSSEGENKFIIPESVGKITTEGRFDWTLSKFPRGTNILAEQEFSLGAKGASMGLGKFGNENLALSVSKVNVIPKSEAATLFQTGTRYGEDLTDNAFLRMSRDIKASSGKPMQSYGLGISEQVESGLFKSAGGKLNEIKITTSPGRGIEFKGNLDAFGYTKIVSEESFGDAFGGTFNLGGKSPGRVSKGFTGSGSSVNAVEQVSKSLNQEAFLSSITSSTKLETPQAFSPSGLPSIGLRVREEPFSDMLLFKQEKSFTSSTTASKMVFQSPLQLMSQKEVAYRLPLQTEMMQPKLGLYKMNLPLANPLINFASPEPASNYARPQNFLARPVPPILNMGFGGINGITPFMPGLSMPQMGWGESLGRSFKVRRNYKYAPSIGAVLSGFTMPKITSGVKFAEMTGFMARPVITGSSRKKKKRR